MKPYIFPLIFGCFAALISALFVIEGFSLACNFLLISILTVISLIFFVPTFLSKIKNLFFNLKWWHILWTLYWLSGLTFRLRFAKSTIENPLDKAAMFRVLLVSFVGTSLLLAFPYQRNIRLGRIFGGPIKWLFIFNIICILSTIWSCFPLWTLYRSVEYFIGIFLVSIIVCNLKTEEEFKHFFDWTIFLYSLLMLSVWFGVIWKPDIAINHRIGLLGIQIKGIFPKIAANGVGHISALVGLVCFVRLLLYKCDFKFYFIVFIVSVVTLILSQSRSPLTGFFLGIILVLFFSRKIKWVIFLTSVGIIIAFTSFLNVFMEFFMRGQNEELFWLLSGRIPAWKAALSLLMKNPILGYGAYAAGRFLVGLKYGYLMSSLHSDWVETLIDTGIVGFTFLLISLLAVWLTILKDSNLKSLLCQQLRLEAIGILTLLTFRSIFSVPLIWHPATPWLLIVGFSQFLKVRNADFSNS